MLSYYTSCVNGVVQLQWSNISFTSILKDLEEKKINLPKIKKNKASSKFLIILRSSQQIIDQTRFNKSLKDFLMRQHS